MLNNVLMLAQEGKASPMEAFSGAVARLDLLNHPEELLTALAGMHIVWASVLVVVGALCVLNGYRWHKWVIIICAFLMGLVLGKLLSQQMGQSRIVMAAIGLLFAVAATPFVRYAVAIFGGLTGAFIGANAWSAFSDSPDSHLAGAAMGFIAMGMAAFLMYRLVIVLFTSIGGGAMAVIIEDDPSVRALLEKSLTPLGYRVSLCKDGLEGLTRLETERPDLIIVDIMMPRLDGMTFVKALKADPDRKSIPVIFLTAKNDARARIDGINVGAKFYMTKPFTHDELIDKINKACGSGSGS